MMGYSANGPSFEGRNLRRKIATLAIFSCLCVSASAADNSPIVLTISGPQTVSVGEKIQIWGALKNGSAQKIEIASGEPYTVEIRDQNGKEPPLKPGLWGAGCSCSTVGVEPGKTFKEGVTDLGVYDLSVPGKYFVRAKRLLHYRYSAQGSEENTILESNELTITVVPKQPRTADPTPPFTVQISPSRSGSHPGTTSWRLGEAVRIFVEMKNNSQQSLHITMINPAFDYGVVVLDSHGRPVPKTKFLLDHEKNGFMFTRNVRAELKPGEIRSEAVDVSLLYEIAKPGDYTIQAQHNLPFELGEGVAKSNFLGISITK